MAGTGSEMRWVCFLVSSDVMEYIFSSVDALRGTPRRRHDSHARNQESRLALHETRQDRYLTSLWL